MGRGLHFLFFRAMNDLLNVKEPPESLLFGRRVGSGETFVASEYAK